MGGDDDIGSWVPVTKLGRLVKEKLIKRLEEVYLYSLPIKEPQIIDWFLGQKLRRSDENHAGAKTNASRSAHTLQGVHRCRRSRRSHWPGRQVRERGGHRHSRRHRQRQSERRADSSRLLGNKVGQPHTVPCKLTGK